MMSWELYTLELTLRGAVVFSYSFKLCTRAVIMDSEFVAASSKSRYLQHMMFGAVLELLNRLKGTFQYTAPSSSILSLYLITK